jgi:hypothetical protein
MTNARKRYGFLALAYVLHIGILALYIFDVVPQQYHRGFARLWFHHGGDEVGYFEIAHSLLSGNPVPQPYTLGFPLLLIPFFVLRPGSVADLVQPVAACWAFVMFPIGQYLLARLTERVSGRRIAGECAVLLWTGLPVLVLATVRSVGKPLMAEVASVHLTWAQMLSDGPATLFALLTIYLFVRTIGPRDSRRAYVLLGLVAGFSVMVRPTNCFAVIAIFTGLLVARRIPEAFTVIAFAFIAFLPQLLYNEHAFGGLLRFGYFCGGGAAGQPCIPVDTLAVEDQFAARHLIAGLSYFWSRLGWAGLFAAAAGLAVVATGIQAVWQRDRIVAIVLVLWLAAHVAFHGIYAYTWTGNAVRYAMPILPEAIALFAIGAAVLWQAWPRLGRGIQP